MHYDYFMYLKHSIDSSSFAVYRSSHVIVKCISYNIAFAFHGFIPLQENARNLIQAYR